MTPEATDLVALKRLAEEATPGPWDTDENSVWGACDPDDTTSRGMGINILQCRASVPRWAKAPLDYEQSERNAAFIAAANPATILSLAALIEAQAAEIEEARRLLSESADLTSLCTTPERFGEAGSGEVFLRMTAHNAQVRAFLASRTERADG